MCLKNFTSMNCNEIDELILSPLKINTAKENIPSRPLQQRPINIGGADFHPLYPPKVFKTKVGFKHTGGVELIGASVVMNETARSVWRTILNENSTLWDTRIENFTPAFEAENPLAGGIYTHPMSETEVPKIALPKDWKRAVGFPKTTHGFPILEYIAEGIGCSVGEVTDDIIATYVLAHELGHAFHSTGQTYEQYTQERVSQLAALPAENFRGFLRKFPDATTQETKDFLLKYRQISREAGADKFAFVAMTKHPDLFK